MKKQISLTCLISAVLFITGCLKEDASYRQIKDPVIEEITSFIRDQPGLEKLGANYAENLINKIDKNNIHFRKFKKTDVLVAPIKTEDGTITNLVMEKKDGRISAGYLFNIKATGTQVSAANFFDNYLLQTPNEFDGKFSMTNMHGLELFNQTYTKGKITDAQFLRPVSKSNSAARQAPNNNNQLASFDHPTTNCVEWFRVFYNPATLEVYNMVYLYTECTTEGSGSGGSGGEGGGGSTSDYVYVTPCDQAAEINANTDYSYRLDLLKWAAQNNRYETVLVNGVNTTGVTGWNSFSNYTDNHTVQFSLSSFQNQSITSMAHNHYEGGLSIFSPADMRSVYYALRDNKIADWQKFNMGLVTNSGTTYTMQILNYDQFMAFGNQTFADDISYNAFSHAYSQIYDIRPSNSAAYNETKFLNFLKAANIGLSLFKGNFETLGSWKPYVQSGSSTFTITECP